MSLQRHMILSTLGLVSVSLLASNSLAAQDTLADQDESEVLVAPRDTQDVQNVRHSSSHAVPLDIDEAGSVVQKSTTTSLPKATSAQTPNPQDLDVVVSEDTLNSSASDQSTPSAQSESLALPSNTNAEHPQIVLPLEQPIAPSFDQLQNLPEPTQASDQELESLDNISPLQITGGDDNMMEGTVGVATKPEEQESTSEFKLEIMPAKAGMDAAQWRAHTSAPELIYFVQKYEQEPTRPNEILASIVKSAFKGVAKDQAALGDMYRTGFALKIDYAKAKYWYELAAAQNDSDAQYCLSYLYAMGLGVKQDYNQARIWSELAAEANNSMAQFMLANLYLQGLSVEQDFDTARLWFEKAAHENNNPDAQYGLALMYTNGTGVRLDQYKARAYLEDAAAQNHVLAMHMLGEFYYVGRGGPIDEKRAWQLWTTACSKGEKQSCSKLSR